MESNAQIDTGNQQKEVEFIPLKYVPSLGSSQSINDFRGTTLVIPTLSAGMSPMIAADLFILNEGLIPSGYLKSEYISPVVQNDTVMLEGSTPGTIQMPVVLYKSSDNKYTFILMRTSVTSGNMRRFGAAFSHFIKEAGFKQIIMLTSTISPVKRDRESNREIPEIWAYVNNFLYKQHIDGEGKKSYYDTYQIKKYGNWLGDAKKKPHQELKEMLGAGASDKLMKDFNRLDIPVQLFIIFTPGGIDFVGGFTYYEFLKTHFDQNGSVMAGKTLGKVNHADGFKTGEEIHERIFKEKKLKTPVHWAQIVSYY